MLIGSLLDFQIDLGRVAFEGWMWKGSIWFFIPEHLERFHPPPPHNALTAKLKVTRLEHKT